MRQVLVFAAVVLLGACGTKGGLVLPPAKPLASATPTAAGPSADDSSKAAAEAAR